MTDDRAYDMIGVLLQRSNEASWSLVSFTSGILRNPNLTMDQPNGTVPQMHTVCSSGWRHYKHGKSFSIITGHISLQ